MRTRLAHIGLMCPLAAGLSALALTLSANACASALQPVVVSTCDGQDWSLSQAYEEGSESGLFSMGVESESPLVRHRGFTLTWAELNPAPGEYDWSRVDQILKRAEEGDHGVILRLKASVTGRRSPWGDLAAVPKWVLSRSKAPLVRTRDKGRRDWIEIVVPWNSQVQSAYLDFVKAFGEQRFLRHRRLLGLYVHGISTSYGEEFWLDEKAVANLRPVGLTPEILDSTFGERLEAWAAAAGQDVGRLAWVGVGWIAAGDEWRAYKRVADQLDDRAIKLGLGRRWGHSEAYNRKLDEAGQSVDAKGFLRTDGAHPLVSGMRYWGGENEVWHGKQNDAFDYRRATLRALQMRMRLLWVKDAGVELDPEISEYFARTAGRSPTDSPDAWSVLREVEVRQGSKKQLVGNLDRWLVQRRDSAADASTRSHMIRRLPQSKDWDEPIEWTARTLDRASGGRHFRFDIDPAFAGMGVLRDVRVQVTVIDSGASWHLEVADQAGASQRSEVITGRGDENERTITLRVPALSITDAQPEVSIVADRGDLTVSRVRIARSNALPVPQKDCQVPVAAEPSNG